jgi:hypothetical protein
VLAVVAGAGEAVVALPVARLVAGAGAVAVAETAAPVVSVASVAPVAPAAPVEALAIVVRTDVPSALAAAAEAVAWLPAF